MPELAELIEVTGAPGAYSIRIDGTELPCYVLDGVTATSRKGEMSALTISIPAEKIVFAESEPEMPAASKGVKVGTAYIEVRPRFTGFDGEEFEQAVRRVVDAQSAYVCNRRAFRP